MDKIPVTKLFTAIVGILIVILFIWLNFKDLSIVQIILLCILTGAFIAISFSSKEGKTDERST
ncbi:Uncharacterised protein [uncultured archaeon]|nr:Uncharacterised protein [uncultured archaeon]